MAYTVTRRQSTSEPMNAPTLPQEPESRPTEVGASSSVSLAVEGFDWKAFVGSPGFVPGVAVVFAISVLFWTLLKELPRLWMGNDGYYSHGFLIPLMAGFIVQSNWDRLSRIKISPSYWALIPLAVILFLVRAGTVGGIQIVLSLGVVATLFCGVWFVAGWRWALGLLPATAYLLFALPIWSMAINTYTNPLQTISTKVAYQMLQLAGFQPYTENTTTIHLNTYTLDVGVPCSGLKLVVALSAFTVFFMLIARLKFGANLLLAALVLPLCLFINGLRIALIGVVGEQYGSDAGAAFHDWSGYITLVLCFYILFRIVRLLGWKD